MEPADDGDEIADLPGCGSHRRHGRTGFLSGELRRAENATIYRKLRTAILRGLRPTSLLLGKQPHSKWNRLDFVLLEAFQQHEDETSSSSGLPVFLTRAISSEVGFQIEEVVDQADKALDEWDEKHAGDKRPKGSVRYAVPVNLITGEPLELSGVLRDKLLKETSEGMIGSTVREVDDGVEIEILRPGERYDPREYGDG